jgi:two-component system CheB/CheR fusion protein
MSSRPPTGLAALIEYLKRSRGFDFTGYKPASLERRIRKRMQGLNVQEYADYIDYLEVHPEEFEILFNTILINVTAFFRDPGAWDFVAKQILPDLLSRKPEPTSIRIWSAGCASGEEAYTLAMILAEALGAPAYKERIKIYATDVDEEALNRARAATYDAREVESVPPSLLETYFEKSDSRYVFRKDLRRNVIFGRHDLIQDAPISRVDLLVCRNTLMYFNAETQARILTRFNFALNDNGILFLGRAETLLTHANTFAPIDLRRRISAKVPRASLGLRDRLLLIAQNAPPDETGNGLDLQMRLREAALESAPTAQLVVDTSGALVLANDRARSMFALSTAEIGRPIQDLKISYRPVEIRSSIDQAYTDRLPITIRDVEWHSAGGETRWLDVLVAPLLDTAAGVIGASIAFTDVSASKRLQRELEHATQELETAYEELQSTNEELETTNEELQSTVEELETTNEELQSTNEELETMNEELQSTNEELQTINEELRQRSEELNNVNAFLESILTSLRGGVAVVDTDLKVLVWNERANDLWGMRADEVVGRNILGIDIGLPIDRLRQPLRDCLSGAREYIELQLDATNRRGRSILCRVTCSPLLGFQQVVRGVIVVMEDLEVESAQPRRELRGKRSAERQVES